jgi:PhzF family phenazine biosynthesis protein
MELSIYQVDAFCKDIFTGNPAAVIPLESWPADSLLQQIASENNLAETAFFVPHEDHFHLRWFTPAVEVSLCGHATLATAHVLFHHKNYAPRRIRFKSLSGDLFVSRETEALTLDFPADTLTPVELTEELNGYFGQEPAEAYKGVSDIMLVFDNESQIVNLQPNFGSIAKAQARGVIATAKGDKVDFVSRWFGPQVGVNEDPVTGSAHTTLTPYWSSVLKKSSLEARQLSPRKGYLQCAIANGRVFISGLAKTYLEGKIFLP